MTPEEMEARIAQLESDVKLLLSYCNKQEEVIGKLVRLVGKLVSFHVKPPKMPDDTSQCMYH